MDMNMKNSKHLGRVVVFGIFDGVHEGHRDFLRQAREYGDKLIVIVGRDKISEQLKHKKPNYSENERLKFIEGEPLVDRVVLGDAELSTYKMLEELNPDVVCLGYDQQELGKDLEKWMKENKKEIPIYHLKPHKPDTHHSSRLS